MAFQVYRALKVTAYH